MKSKIKKKKEKTDKNNNFKTKEDCTNVFHGGYGDKRTKRERDRKIVYQSENITRPFGSHGLGVAGLARSLANI